MMSCVCTPVEHGTLVAMHVLRIQSGDEKVISLGEHLGEGG